MLRAKFAQAKLQIERMMTSNEPQRITHISTSPIIVITENLNDSSNEPNIFFFPFKKYDNLWLLCKTQLICVLWISIKLQMKILNKEESNLQAAWLHRCKLLEINCVLFIRGSHTLP